ncbi:hypothetical protein PR202_gb01670 [Eleusine coracana subsp. coracana]|uniref:Cysteine proteinase inhibitor n=1 Tax=Eleusine coracana subsp. coracana TaxID=191504 RepID=A0AAV5DW93_ELECO|nr:hypothetical protein PR202_gb01670 [Eleusine coracana subsp. coracana]
MSFSCSCFPPRNRSHRTAPMPERPKECIITWHRITERPMRRKGMLKFERLVKVRHQLVSGMLYFFTVKVKEGCTKKLYEATVWEQSWTNFKQLSSFRPVATETTTTA